MTRRAARQGCCSSVALVCAVARCRAGDQFADAVAELGGDSFAAKGKAVVALGKLGDPRAVPS